MSSPQHSLRRVFYIASAHIAVDFYMTLFPPLFALFKTHFALTLFQASLIPSVVSIVGSMVQPFTGYLGDRGNRTALAALGLLVCGLSISAIGLSPSVYALALFLTMGSLGSSIFHPIGGSLATAFVPHRSNLAMAVFLTGGTLGMSLAPLAGTQAVERYGLGSTWVFVFPALIISGILFSLSRRKTFSLRQQGTSRFDFSILRTAALRPLWTLYAISVLRSLSHYGFLTFTSVLGQERGWSTGRIGWILTAFLIISTLGRIGGGYLGDRISPRKLLGLSNLLSAPFFIGFAWFAGPGSLPLFFAAGFLFDLGIATNIVLAQRLLPQNTSTATGLVMGFAWGTAGFLIPLIGTLAEVFSLPIALVATSSLLFPAAALVAVLPSEREEKHAAGTAVGDA